MPATQSPAERIHYHPGQARPVTVFIWSAPQLATLGLAFVTGLLALLTLPFMAAAVTAAAVFVLSSIFLSRPHHRDMGSWVHPIGRHLKMILRLSPRVWRSGADTETTAIGPPCTGGAFTVGVDSTASPDLGLYRSPDWGTWSVTAKVSAKTFTMTDLEEQERIIAMWSLIQASFAAVGSPVSQVQLMERVAPLGAETDPAQLMWEAHQDLDCPTAADYQQLLDAGTATGLAHQGFLTIQISDRSAAQHLRDTESVLRKRSSETRIPRAVVAAEVLRTELNRLSVSLEAIGTTITALSHDELDQLVRTQFEPFIATDGTLASAWPHATHVNWKNYVAGDVTHVTSWVTGIRGPIIDPSWFSGMLMAGNLAANAVRTVTQVMRVVPPDKATKRQERLNYLAEEAVFWKKDNNRRETEADRLSGEADRRREQELASGQSDVEFDVYVVASAAALPDQLDAADESRKLQTEMRSIVGRAGGELRVLYGEQDKAFASAALPSGGGPK